jgi:AcrR family transcriptional regulator
MPKIINHEKQKEKIAEATWRVIQREGLEGATVRKIAKESGLSMGSMRHYFSSQSQLFAFSMELINSKAEQRINSMNLFSAGPNVEDIRRVLLQLLPLDAERKLETQVWLSFSAKSLSDPELQALAGRFYDILYDALKLVLDSLISLNLAKPDLDKEIEAERLCALIDGLGYHCIMRPDQITPVMIESVLMHHLESLCSSKGKK